MFEFRVALKYLLPKRKAISTALISLISVVVISLVVWLVLVFLSVTTGIEKTWLKKLTALNAALRVTPTDAYFQSYYYQIDRLCLSSNYAFKTLGEKLTSSTLDPYDPTVDPELPLGLPQPEGKDLVKELACALKEIPDIAFQDYEMTGALMRLAMIKGEKTSFFSQMSYLISLAENNPYLSSLLLPPTLQDLNHLLYTLSKSPATFQQDSPKYLLPANQQELHNHLQAFFAHTKIFKIKTPSFYSLPVTSLPEGVFKGQVLRSGILIANDGDHTLRKEKDELFLEDKKIAIHSLLLKEPLVWEVEKSGTLFQATSFLQGEKIQASLPYQQVQIVEAQPTTHFTNPPAITPLWAYTCQRKVFLPEGGILLAKSYQDSGVSLGDKGYLSYLASTGLATQEQRQPFSIAGFYDPGIMPIGNRCLIVPMNMARVIGAVTSSFSPDGIAANGFLIWTQDAMNAPKIKKEIEEKLSLLGLSPYFTVATFRDYEFSKDLMLQFQSDRTLFSLIAILIIFVACCNILSLLFLLVHDKKREIAILRAMGASKKSIALIFGGAGTILGMVSSGLGIASAIFTLKHLDSLVVFLSSLQGHAAFQKAFFGDALPNELSHEALLFVLIATPLLALFAGLIPAIHAARLKPSPILRSE